MDAELKKEVAEFRKKEAARGYKTWSPGLTLALPLINKLVAALEAKK